MKQEHILHIHILITGTRSRYGYAKTETNSPSVITEGVSPGVVTLYLSFFSRVPNGILLAARTGVSKL